MKKLVSFVSILILVAVNNYAQDIQLTTGTNISFASKNEGREFLTGRDEYISTMSPFDRSARQKTDQIVSEEEFIQFLSTNALEWQEEEITKFSDIINSIGGKLTEFNLTFPKEILLIKTTGKEEGGAAYTRKNGLFFPENFLKMPENDLHDIVIHELFHVLSRENPTLREELYNIIGFFPCNEIELPENIKARKISNPDAPRNNHYMNVSYKESDVQVIPVIFSKTEKYDMDKGGEFFNYLEFKLLQIEKNNNSWSASYTEQAPVLFDISQVSGFFEQVGKNTQYIIHPEEILADNFVILVNGKQDIPTPEIVAKMKKILAK